MLFALLVLLVLCALCYTIDGIRNDSFFVGFISLIMFADIMAIAIKLMILFL